MVPPVGANVCVVPEDSRYLHETISYTANPDGGTQSSETISYTATFKREHEGL